VTNLPAGAVAGAVAPESIATLRGEALVGSQPELTIIDNTGSERRASLFSASPGHIDYLVPKGTATANAVAIVSRGGATIAGAMLDVEPIAPALFTMADGSTAAAALQRVKPNGSQSYAPVTEAIDLGASTDEVVLVLFGTGIRGGSGFRNTTARVGGHEAAVLYAGPQGGFDGLDQINLQLPRSLIGAGTVDIEVTVDGGVSNIVTVNIR
jgi:uncharacterized protein (TIGR03437 family)